MKMDTYLLIIVNVATVYDMNLSVVEFEISVDNELVLIVSNRQRIIGIELLCVGSVWGVRSQT